MLMPIDYNAKNIIVNRVMENLKARFPSMKYSITTLTSVIKMSRDPSKLKIFISLDPNDVACSKLQDYIINVLSSLTNVTVDNPIGYFSKFKITIDLNDDFYTVSKTAKFDNYNCYVQSGQSSAKLPSVENALRVALMSNNVSTHILTNSMTLEECNELVKSALGRRRVACNDEYYMKDLITLYKNPLDDIYVYSYGEKVLAVYNPITLALTIY